MTRKDYKLIAEVLASVRRVTWSAQGSSVAISAIDDVAERLAVKLVKDNPRFDRKKFLEAARV